MSQIRDAVMALTSIDYAVLYLTELSGGWIRRIPTDFDDSYGGNNVSLKWNGLDAYVLLSPREGVSALARTNPATQESLRLAASQKLEEELQSLRPIIQHMQSINIGEGGSEADITTLKFSISPTVSGGRYFVHESSNTGNRSPLVFLLYLVQEFGLEKLPDAKRLQERISPSSLMITPSLDVGVQGYSLENATRSLAWLYSNSANIRGVFSPDHHASIRRVYDPKKEGAQPRIKLNDGFGKEIKPAALRLSFDDPLAA